MGFDISFYRGRKVFITGHNGFMGSWLCRVLKNIGANVTGYSLIPKPNTLSNDIQNDVFSIVGDIRDYDRLKYAFDNVQPEIVFHLAAQPIVREGYKNPIVTYETNVIGTVNILECIRTSNCTKSLVNVTTDKVYKNREWQWGYRENDEINGFDPYSNSKSCSELVTSSYKNSFLNGCGTAVSTMRVGNVIGGGDFAQDRIIPDCIRSVTEGKDIIIRNPMSIRPYQHVLEAVYVYLMAAALQYGDMEYSGAYNVGPDESSCISTGNLADLFVKYWGDGARWTAGNGTGPHEADILKLDCSLLKTVFNWKPIWNIETAVKKTVEFSKDLYSKGDVLKLMDMQIKEFFDDVQQ